MSFLFPEELVVCTCSLEVGYFVVFAPDKEPVTSVGYMAFLATEPFAFEAVHPVPLTQDSLNP